MTPDDPTTPPPTVPGTDDPRAEVPSSSSPLRTIAASSPTGTASPQPVTVPSTIAPTDLTSPVSVPLDLVARTDGPLHGLRFAAKDNFDVSGIVTSAGNPDWARTHPAPATHATAVQRLLDSGARLTAKTVMDELAYGLMGRNVHSGTPENPAAPARVPGGSSSGSASVVAAGLVDFALGTDTGGSIRVPASWCGLFGIRPSWGRIPIDGVVPLAPLFDTVGWLARDGRTLARVGQAIARGGPSEATTRIASLVAQPLSLDIGRLRAHVPSEIRTVVLCDDLFERADANVRDAILAAVEKRLDPLVSIRHGRLGGDPTAWAEVFRTLQFGAVWEALGPWIEAVRPDVAPDVAARFAQCAALSADALQKAREAHEKIRDTIHAATRDGAVLCFPTTPSIAPLRDFDPHQIEPMRNTLQAFTCIAGLSGAPQISLPLGNAVDAPCGLSLLGAPGQDPALLEMAALISI